MLFPPPDLISHAEDHKMKMDAIPRQDDFFGVGVPCCIVDQAANLCSLRDIEYTIAKQNAVNLKSWTMSSSLHRRSKNLMASPDNDDGNKDSHARHDSIAGCASITKETQMHKSDFRREPRPELMNKPSLMDDDQDEEDFGDISRQGKDGNDTASSEPHLFSPSLEDVLALEVGLTAHDYLEECFYTEISVLDRDKFNAIPEIGKSDFSIKHHLGKGYFCDVFEVVRKDARLRTDASNAISRGTRHGCTSPARGRRLTPSRSFTATSRARAPQCDTRPPVFAMKCLRPQIRSDFDQFIIGAEDIVHETAILAALDHPNIIKLHGRASGNLTDAFILNDGYFILLDRLDETLHERIKKWKLHPECAKKGPTVKQIEVAHSIADAVSYLHSKSIVFRDLKPDNVGFDSMGVLKLFDFGFAIGLPEKDESNPAGFLFDRCGTPRYMAPEVGLSLGYGLKADVYSFGILLWEVCALTKPFAPITSSSDFEIAVFMGGKRPVTEYHWPAAIKELISRCWAAIPNKRPLMSEIQSSLSSTMANINNEKKSQPRTVRPRMIQRSVTAGV